MCHALRERKKNNLGFCGIFQRFVGFYFSCLVYVALHITVKDFKLVFECVFGCCCVCVYLCVLYSCRTRVQLVVTYISLGVGLPILFLCETHSEIEIDIEVQYSVGYSWFPKVRAKFVTVAFRCELCISRGYSYLHTLYT